MKIIENEYGRFGVEVERKGTRKEPIGSYLTFEIGKDENVEVFKPFIKSECFDEFKDKMAIYNFSGYNASILNNELLPTIKKEVYDGKWDNYKKINDGFDVLININDVINIAFSLDFPACLGNFRENDEIFYLLKNDLKERKKVLNRLHLFNAKAKIDNWGFQQILIPNFKIRYFALDREDNIVIMGPTDAFSDALFSNSLSFIDSIKAIKRDIGYEYGLTNEMQYKTKDGKFTTWGFIYPDTDIGEPHPEWIGQFIRQPRDLNWSLFA